MSVRRRRHPNGRFWVLLTVVVLIVAAIIVVTHHHSAKTSVSHHTLKPPTFAMGRWTVSPDSLSQPMANFSVVSTPHTLWILGGVVNGQSTTLVQRINWTTPNHFNPVEDITPGLPVATHNAAAISLPGRIILVGGGSYAASANVFRLPLPTLSPATSLTPLPIPLSDLGAVKDKSSILIIGGANTGAPSNTIWSYTIGKPVTVWGHLPIGIRYPAVASNASTLYVVSGLSVNGPSNQAVAYNLRTHKMTKLPPYPVSVEHAEATVINHTLVVAGGETDAGWITAVYWYDAAQKAWKPGRPLPQASGSGALVTLPSGIGVWIGGQSPSGSMATIWTITTTNKR